MAPRCARRAPGRSRTPAPGLAPVAGALARAPRHRVAAAAAAWPRTIGAEGRRRPVTCTASQLRAGRYPASARARAATALPRCRQEGGGRGAASEDLSRGRALQACAVWCGRLPAHPPLHFQPQRAGSPPPPQSLSKEQLSRPQLSSCAPAPGGALHGPLQPCQLVSQLLLAAGEVGHPSAQLLHAAGGPVRSVLHRLPGAAGGQRQGPVRRAALHCCAQRRSQPHGTAAARCTEQQAAGRQASRAGRGL